MKENEKDGLLRGYLEEIPNNSKEIESAKENVVKDVYDSESWIILLKACKPIDIMKTRNIFEYFLKYYPTSVKTQNK